jgi:hypothetical protein
MKESRKTKVIWEKADIENPEGLLSKAYELILGDELTDDHPAARAFDTKRIERNHDNKVGYSTPKSRPTRKCRTHKSISSA